MIEFLNPVDIHVGARVRSTRLFHNCKLSELATAVGIPTSLLFACESGTSRFLPEHLAAIADHLDVRCSFFFEGLRQKAPRQPLLLPTQMPTERTGLNDDFPGATRRDPA